MNHSGDAAEQIVRMSLEGVEVAARITGTAAKEIALLLLAALKSPEKNGQGGLKLKGKARLESMLKSGKALEIFSVKERDLKTFAQEAKRYGIVYCVLRNSRPSASKASGLGADGICDVMVKADDAPKINRLVERFKFATVDKAKIESEIVRDMEARSEQPAEAPAKPETPGDVPGAEPAGPEINDVDSLLDDLLGAQGSRETEFRGKRRSDGASELSPQGGSEGYAVRDDDGKTAPEIANPETAKSEPDAPTLKSAARGAKEDTPSPDARKDPGPLASGGGPAADSRSLPDSPDTRANGTPSVRQAPPPPPKASQSEPFSDSRKNSERHSSTKPSVKEELREITAARKAKEAEAKGRGEPPIPAKPKEQQQTTAHKQPQNRRKPKSKKAR
jgi:hypothetical protein